MIFYFRPWTLDHTRQSLFALSPALTHGIGCYSRISRLLRPPRAGRSISGINAVWVLAPDLSTLPDRVAGKDNDLHLFVAPSFSLFPLTRSFWLVWRLKTISSPGRYPRNYPRGKNGGAAELLLRPERLTQKRVNDSWSTSHRKYLNPS